MKKQPILNLFIYSNLLYQFDEVLITLTVLWLGVGTGVDMRESSASGVMSWLIRCEKALLCHADFTLGLLVLG